MRVVVVGVGGLGGLFGGLLVKHGQEVTFSRAARACRRCAHRG